MQNHQYHQDKETRLGSWLWETGLFDDDKADELYNLIEEMLDQKYKEGVVVGNHLGRKGILILEEALQDNK